MVGEIFIIDVIGNTSLLTLLNLIIVYQDQEIKTASLTRTASHEVYT